jgi:hypothetical protein
MWGKIKSSGDDWMYPKPLMDLRSSSYLFLFGSLESIFACHSCCLFLSIILLKVSHLVCFFSLIFLVRLRLFISRDDVGTCYLFFFLCSLMNLILPSFS